MAFAVNKLRHKQDHTAINSNLSPFHSPNSIKLSSESSCMRESGAAEQGMASNIHEQVLYPAFSLRLPEVWLELSMKSFEIILFLS
jgi:hypothetical protein